MPEKHVEYFYKEGKSDKVYRIHLNEQFNDKWSVTFEYGRRGSSLTKRDKLQKVPYETAKELFDEMCHERELKGYTQEAGVKPYVGSDKEGKISGELPQLLTDAEDNELEQFLTDDAWGMQEKIDGKRIIIRQKDHVIEAINRKGLIVAIPEGIVSELSEIDLNFVMDGELVGDVYKVFDLLSYRDINLKKQSFKYRFTQLEELLTEYIEDSKVIVLVLVRWTEKQKRKLFDKLKAEGAEGVVFKKLDSIYKAGRPNSGGDQRRYKWKARATVQILGMHEKGKRSAYIQALDGKELVDVGKVTILPNFDLPKPGDIVEVEYLYRHVHGALYQPIYLGVREDKDLPDDVKTLKVKQGVEIEEES